MLCKMKSISLFLIGGYMKIAIETFVASLVIVLGVFINVSYNMNTKIISNAKQYSSSALHKLDAAEFSDEAITECKLEAISDGYKSLEVEKEETPDGRECYAVVLNYQLKIPILNISKDASVKRYAEIGSDGV